MSKNPCMKCGEDLWGSGDSSECVNERCGDKEPESIPVPYVWGSQQFWNPKSMPINIPLIYFDTEGARNEQKNRSNH